MQFAHFSGASAQCPPLYEFVGGKCFLFLPALNETFANATEICASFDGTLAKIDDCGLLTEVANYLEDIDSKHMLFNPFFIEY